MDWGVVLIWVALMAIGIVSVYAAGFNEEHANLFDLANRSGQQVLWVGVACLIAIMVIVIESRFYTLFTVFFYIIMLLLMAATFLFGREINGSKSWLSFGPVGIQTVEFMKIATALLLAKAMSAHGFKIGNIKDFLRAALLIVLPFALTLLQHDTGSALVFSAFIIVFYRAGLRPWVVISCIFLIFLFILSLLVEQYAIVILMDLLCLSVFLFFSRQYKAGAIVAAAIAVIALALHVGLQALEVDVPLFEALLIANAAIIPVALAYAFWNKLTYVLLLAGFFTVSVGTTYSVDYVFDNVLQEHQRRRINDLLGIESDLRGWGYNVHQSKVAIGSGGFTGKGFLEGAQTKGNFVPEQTTDFIFCTVGEEWGFVGAFVVVGLYLLLLLRLLNIAERQKSLFAKLYGYCVVSVLFFHVFVNIGMTIGIMPVVGIPLPFISYGGSSLWAFTTLIFILLNFDVSRYD
jgi:rod shape determining protein RodA